MKTNNVRLGDLIKVRHGGAFKSKFFSEEDIDNPILVNIGNFKYDGGFRFESTKIKRYVGEYPIQYELKPNDILLIMTCQTSGGEILGVPAKVPSDSETYLHNQRLGKVEIMDESLVDEDFLYWLFLSSDFNRHLFSSASGTKILHTSPDRIESYQFSLPSIKKQKKVSDILRSIQDKIDLNQVMNKTLEEMAETLYKHWFFDFEPYKDEDFKESELGLIPSDWGVINIGNAVEILGGGTPKTSTNEFWEDGDINWFSPTDLTSQKSLFVTNSAKKITQLGLEKSSAKLFKPYSIMMTSRATIGEISINRNTSSTNQGFITLIPNDSFTLYQLYFWLRTNMDRINSIANGSTFKEVSKTNFKMLPILKPARIQTYINESETIFKQIESNILEIEMLTELRDYLLPRLMS